ncbi:MAG: EAL domain-containing response regulator [Alphaproteobacteria bacterium]|nr:EAL domain-containing response regulator [Alphaproteobacteria bacterium]
MSRILVVLDDQPARRSVARGLARAGHEVRCTADRDEALRIAGPGSVDVIVVGHPHLDDSGVAVLAALRTVHPRAARLMLADNPRAADLLAAINRAGVHRVLSRRAGPQAIDTAITELRERPQASWPPPRDQAALAQALSACFAERLVDGGLGIALQPIVHAESASLHAVEVLARVPADRFASTHRMVEAAEEAGMLAALSQAVVGRVVSSLDAIPDQAKIFVNLHPDELVDVEGLPARLAPLAPWAHRCVLEVTERGPTRPFRRWLRTLDRIASMGFSLAIDDLGAGYSGLRMLAELQPDYIKIDMGIVRDVDVEAPKQRLVELVCRFAEASGSKVVAEGVETHGEAEMLIGAGVPLLQGYLYGRPQLAGAA